MTIPTLDSVQFIQNATYGLERKSYTIGYMLNQEVDSVDTDEVEAVKKARKSVQEGRVLSREELFGFLAS